jgi:hypothetical protein
MMALATATDWRCPPDSEPTTCRIDCTVVTRRSARVLLGGQLHADLVQQAEPELLVTEHHIGHDVQVVSQGQVLVDGRDAERGGVPGPVQVHRLAFPDELAGARLPDPRES